jgi:hypothetical protein
LTCDFWAENEKRNCKKNKQKQIPFGDDNQNAKAEADPPLGMTTKKQRQKQIPFGDDNQKAKAEADPLRG